MQDAPRVGSLWRNARTKLVVRVTISSERSVWYSYALLFRDQGRGRKWRQLAPSAFVKTFSPVEPALCGRPDCPTCPQS